LANPALKPGRVEISFAVAIFREYLQIRKSSPLFRLRTAAAVQRSVSFLNTGPGQIPGLIVLQLTDADNIDPVYKRILVFFNAGPQLVRFVDDACLDLKFELHPVQAASVDEMLRQADFDTSKGLFSIPARTTAVFVLRNKSLPAAI
jgi:hypothetical protein